MARTKSTARKSTPILELKVFLEIKLLEKLINEKKIRNDENYNIINEYLKIAINIFCQKKEEDFFQQRVVPFFSKNQDEIKKLEKQIEQIKDLNEKERSIIEFLIKNASEFLSHKLFYEFYENYFIKKYGGDLIDSHTYEEILSKENEILSLVKNIENTNIKNSLSLISMNFLSYRAYQVLSNKRMQVPSFEKKPILFNFKDVVQLFKLLFSDMNIGTYWMQSFLMNFNTLKTNDKEPIDINELLQVFEDNKPYSIQTFERFRFESMKDLNCQIWKWFIQNTIVNKIIDDDPSIFTLKFKSLRDSVSNISILIDSIDVINFIFIHDPLFQLLPSESIKIGNLENNKNYKYSNILEYFKNNNNKNKNKNNKNKNKNNKNNNSDDKLIVIPETISLFKFTNIQLANYFYKNLLSFREKKFGIIEGRNEENFKIKKSHIYFNLFTQSIKNCEINKLKQLDELNLKFSYFLPKSFERENSYCEFSYGPNYLDDDGDEKKSRKLFSSVLYQDKKERENLFKYLNETGFKSFTPDLFYGLFGNLFFTIDGTIIGIAMNEYQESSDFEMVIKKIKNKINYFNNDNNGDQEILNNIKLLDLSKNQTLLHQLILDSIYKLNLPMLNILINQLPNKQINHELFLNIYENDKKEYSFALSLDSFRNSHQFSTIYSIIQILIEKLKINNFINLFTYLYKLLIQSKNCTFEENIRANQLYQTHSIPTENDFFNIVYWLSNKSKRISMLLLETVFVDQDFQIGKYFSNITDRVKYPSETTNEQEAWPIDFNIYQFEFIKSSSFTQILNSFKLNSLFKENSKYFLNIGRSDLYMKFVKKNLVKIPKKRNGQTLLPEKTPRILEIYHGDLQSFIELNENNLEEIEELLKLQIFPLQKFIDNSLKLSQLETFKFILNYIDQNNQLIGDSKINFNELNDCYKYTFKFIKYLVENYPNQFEEYLYTLDDDDFINEFWITNIQETELILAKYPDYLDKNKGILDILISRSTTCNGILNYYIKVGLISKNIFTEEQIQRLKNSRPYQNYDWVKELNE